MRHIDMYVQYGKRSIWNNTELAEKAISAPNRQGLPQKDVEGNITLLIRESKNSPWNKWLSWHHQRGSSIEKTSDWHVRNTRIDDPHRKNQFQNNMQKKTPFNYCINRRKASDVISSPFPQRRCSSDGRPLALYAGGTGVDAPHLQFFRGARQSKKEIREAVLLDQKKTWILTSTMQKEASETVQSLLRKRLVPRNTKVYLRKTSKETLLYW